MSFSEICIYQVAPQKVQEFESLMAEAKNLLEKQKGLITIKLIKRDHRIDMQQIKDGLPPLEITRIVKCVKYMLYWEFDSKENYGAAQKNLYESFWKSIDKCLIVPHDKYLGNVIFFFYILKISTPQYAEFFCAILTFEIVKLLFCPYLFNTY